MTWMTFVIGWFTKNVGEIIIMVCSYPIPSAKHSTLHSALLAAKLARPRRVRASHHFLRL